jgi:hypothetical protein
VWLEYRRTTTGSGQVRAVAARRGGNAATGWATLGAGSHVVELAWISATSGSLQLWLDGARSAVTGVDTSAGRVETARLGVSSGLTSSMTGSLSLDRFVSTRGSPIGQ